MLLDMCKNGNAKWYHFHTVMNVRWSVVFFTAIAVFWFFAVMILDWYWCCVVTNIWVTVCPCLPMIATTECLYLKLVLSDIKVHCPVPQVDLSPSLLARLLLERFLEEHQGSICESMHFILHRHSFFPRDTRVTGGRTCGTWLTIKCSADHPPLNCCLDQCSSISSVLFITPVFFPSSQWNWEENER